MTIRGKLSLLYSGLLAIIIVAFGISLFAVTHWVLVTSVNTTLTQTADQIFLKSRIFVVRQFGVPTLIFALPPELDSFFRASGVGVQVWQLDEEGPKLLDFSSNMDDFATPIDPDALNKATIANVNAEGMLDSGYSTVRLTGDWRVLTLPFEYRGWRVAIQAAAPFETVNLASRRCW
jgi:hypothetical protein